MGGLALAACSGTGSDDASARPSTATSSSAATANSPTSSSLTRTSTTTSSATSTSSSTSVAPALACARRLAGSMSPAQKAGQLVWPALDASAGASGLDATITGHDLGGIFYLGGWRGAQTVAAASQHVQTLAPRAGGLRVGLFVAADQEGGEVQQLQGSGFTTIPSARSQDAMTSAELATAAAGWARELSGAGVNLNLAPVADTVPTSLGTGNAPIGRYHREFSSSPTENARMVPAFVKGMHTGKVGSTAKHFPGLGRVRENTDVSATGITDSVTTTRDPYLAPFVAAIKAGTDVVMVSSAIYSRIDASTNAAFSAKVVTDLLRERMGFGGVVMSDDLGVAKAVAAVPVGQRATRFVAAGGDVVLTADPSAVSPMTAALTQRYGTDGSFRDHVDASVTRVLTLKVNRGLASCS